MRNGGAVHHNIIKGRRGVLKIDKKREMADIGSQMPAISRFWANQRFLNVRREGEARKHYMIVIAVSRQRRRKIGCSCTCCVQEAIVICFKETRIQSDNDLIRVSLIRVF